MMYDIDVFVVQTRFVFLYCYRNMYNLIEMNIIGK